MFILDTHIHKLIFRIDNNAPKKYMDRWNKLKYDCEQGDNKYIIETMKTYCKLEENKNIPYLEREEGGIGGNDNSLNKQIRFLRLYENFYQSFNERDIILNQIYNTDTEKWTYRELDDLIFAFIKTFNFFVKEECVTGCIEMSNEDGY